jgi:Tfp pilus assembly protein PilW
MRNTHPEAGFTLMELMAATALGLIVIGTAMTTFKDAVGMTSTASNVADASQNLRGGTNFLIHDLVQAGRGIPIGGIPIPTGAGSGPLLRPSPPGMAYAFNNTTATTLTAITTGSNLGPTVDNQQTDIVTMLTIDGILDSCLSSPLSVRPAGTGGGVPTITATGSSFDVVNNNTVRCTDGSGDWLAGSSSQSGVTKGDLLLFTDPNGRNAIQTVTRTDGSTVFFEQNADDTFGFNQPAAAAGSITQLLGQALSVQRVIMYTYYVDPNNGTPRLMRRYNMAEAQALAGVVEDLQLTYDLVDGSVNPTNVADLPYPLNGVTYSANQIRKVAVHIGVRSETMSTRLHDYLRNHLSTVVSIRNLAFVDRYK